MLNALIADLIVSSRFHELIFISFIARNTLAIRATEFHLTLAGLDRLNLVR